MSRYRKKPVVIEAFRWSADENQTEDPDWICEAFADGRVVYIDNGGTDVGLLIPTLEGQMMASVGDWIVRGVQGELYPVKPDIFEATYELVGE